MIVPYIPRHVFPLIMYFYLFEDEDEDNNNHNNHNEFDNDEEEEQQQQQYAEEQQRQAEDEEPLPLPPPQTRMRIVFITLTSSYNANVLLEGGGIHSDIDISDDHVHDNSNNTDYYSSKTKNGRSSSSSSSSNHTTHSNIGRHNHNSNNTTTKINVSTKTNTTNAMTTLKSNQFTRVPFGILHHENDSTNTQQERHQQRQYKECMPQGYDDTINTINTIKVLQDIPGMLEYIILFLQPNDILHCTSYINKRFYIASRNDGVWKSCCIYKWKNKLNTPKVRNWNIYWKKDVAVAITGKTSRTKGKNGSGGDSVNMYCTIENYKKR